MRESNEKQSARIRVVEAVRTAALGVCFFFVSFFPVLSQDDSTPLLLEYRRWLAPRDRIEEWPLGQGRYVPLKRDLFELWTDFLKETPDPDDEPAAECLLRIVLHAKLEGRQLVDGQGFFDFRPPAPLPVSGRAAAEARRSGLASTSSFLSIPLDSWGLWIDAPTLEDGTPVSVAQTADGALRLILPRDSGKGSPSERQRVRFSWSLRSRLETQGRLQFDLQLPPCHSIELNLDLPDFVVPSIPHGIVLAPSAPKEGKTDQIEESAANTDEKPATPKRRHWRLLPGRQSPTRLTLSVDEKQDAAQQKTAFFQRLQYSITPQGMDVTTRIHFDREDPFAGNVILELDEPLRPVEVRYGDQLVSWSSFSTDAPGSTFRLLVDLAEQGKGELRELRVVALTPVVTDRLWNLPQIRVVSPNVFWKETRSGVIVQNPLTTRRLSYEQAVQVSPVTTGDRDDCDVFAFQFFRDDARIALELGYHVPETILNSFIQVLWGGNEITGSMVVDCSLAEGDRYTLEFPVSPHWTINEVKTIFEDAILSWDIVEERDSALTEDRSIQTPRTLSIQLKRPLRPREGLRLQIRGRFQPTDSKEWRLADAAPLALPRRRDESHFIAIRPESPYHLQYLSPVPSTLEIRDPLDPRLSRRFVDPPQGTVFPLDAQSQEIRFGMERLKPNYSAEIEGTVQIKEGEFAVSYRIRCLPIDSSVDRVCVYFTSGVHLLPELPETSPENAVIRPPLPQWNGSIGTIPTPVELQVRAMTSAEAAELLPARNQGYFSEASQAFEVWEVRLPSPQTEPFEIRVLATLPLGDETTVPLVSLPAALSQKGEIYIKSPRLYPYQIVNTRLRSIPISPAEWYRYQETRAAFRYDPSEELRYPPQSSLTLKKIDAGLMPPAAWVWSFRLDTQYEHEGIVKNNAVFLLENRGKDHLRIDLPDGVRLGDVHAVWLNDDRVTWYPDKTGNGDLSGSVVVALPESTRFVSVSLEYSYKDVSLTQRHTLASRSPTVDVPILGENRTAWFPPDFDVRSNTRTDSSSPASRNSGPRISKAFGLFLQDCRFDPLSGHSWKRLFYGGDRRQESIHAARIFTNWLLAGLDTTTDIHRSSDELPPELSSQDFVTRTVPRIGGDFPTKAETTWSDLLSNEKLLAEMLNLSETDAEKALYRDRRQTGRPHVRLLIDGRSFARFGLAPTTPIRLPDAFVTSRHGLEILNWNGLVLLVSVEADENGETEYTFYLTTVLAAAAKHRPESEPIGKGVRYLPGASTFLASSTEEQWIPAEQWLRETPVEVFPWSIAPQIIRLVSVTPDWIARDLPSGTDSTLYVVHRQTSSAFYWLAFLAAIILTWKKPFSSPICLLPLLVVFEVLTRCSVPCYESVPGGAFLGTLVSLGFSLIRSSRPDFLLRGAWRRSRSDSSPVLSPTASAAPDSAPSGHHDEIASEGSALPQRSSSEKTSPSIRTEDFFNHFGVPSGKQDDVVDDGSTVERNLSPDSPSSPVLPTILFILVCLSLAGPASAQSVSTTATEGFFANVHREQSRLESNRTERREPYRVFFPVDESSRIVGNDVWIPEDFFLALYRSTQRISPRTLHRWSIESATYEGSLVYNPLTQGMSIPHFKVVFEVLLDEENTTITLPPLPLAPDGALWDSSPIQPAWRIREDRAGEATSPGENSILAFDIENEKKGRHTLELQLVPKIDRVDDTRSVSMDVPKVPRTSLYLNVPPESPTISVSDCLGAVLPNTIVSPTLRAETGPSGKIAFSWIDEAASGEPASVQVESFHWLRARPTQVDLRTKLRYRVEGGRIRHLTIQTDPRWQLSGQYHCEEHPIDKVETHYDPIGTGDVFSSHGEVTRLVFKSPVSGPLTIRAGYVLKDFSGIGRVRLPRIGPLQSRIVKSMLAVSAEPLLELDYPTTGLGAGFESGWYGTQSTAPSLVVETTGAGKGATAQEQPLAEYDLTKTSPSWTLSIRTKKIPPKLTLTQSYRFDHGDSTVLCVGNFQAESEVFQQTFSVPDEFLIESIDVRDAQDNLVDILPGESVYVPGNRRRERTVFFKKSLSGTYRIVVLGHFPSETPPHPSSRSSRTAVPFLSFHDVSIEEHRMEFFRTPAILAEVRIDDSAWTRSEVAPVAPKIFADPLIVGSWKTDANDSGGTDARRAPTYLLQPNRPVIRGETIASLSRNETTGLWETTFDLLWDINRGELESLRFRWDERLGSVLSVEPPVPWTLEQKNGHSQLLLSPRIPFSGRQLFRIRTTLSNSGGAVSLPDMTPIPDKIDSLESTTYVILPRNSGDELLPWNLERLAPVDAETIEYLKTRTATALGMEKTTIPIPALWNPDTAADGSTPPPDTDDEKKNATPDAIAMAEPLYYRATGDSFVAAIVPRSSRPVVTLYDIDLFVRNDGTVFGKTTFDLKARGHESLILKMPPDFELIRIASAGIASEGTLRTDQCWKIDLCASDYPQRLGVIFRGTLSSREGDSVDGLGRRIPFSGHRLRKEKIATSIPLPTLENVEIRETLWTLSFQSDAPAASPPLAVSTVYEEERDDYAVTGDYLKRDVSESLGRHTPVSGLEASQTLLKLDLVRLDHLLYVLDSIPLPSPTKLAEVRRWYSQWAGEWGDILSLIDRQRLRYPTVLHSDEHAVLIDPGEHHLDGSATNTIGAFLDFIKIPESTLQALLVRQRHLAEQFGFPSIETLRRTPFSTGSIIHFRQQGTGKTAHLFGATGGHLKELRIVSQPGPYRWSEFFRNRSLLWLVFPVVLLILMQRMPFAELFERFPHFWGAAAGLLFWSLFPPGWFGLSVLLLVFFSLFHSAWPRHTEQAKMNA